jgi:hypothetical protein
MGRLRIDLLGSGAFLAHALLARVIYSQHFEGSWGGFLLFIVDFPASLLFLVPGLSGSWLAMTVIGGAWWYFVATSLRRLSRRSSKLRGDDHGNSV